MITIYSSEKQGKTGRSEPMRVARAAEILGVSKSTVRRYAKLSRDDSRHHNKYSIKWTTSATLYSMVTIPEQVIPEQVVRDSNKPNCADDNIKKQRRLEEERGLCHKHAEQDNRLAGLTEREIEETLNENANLYQYVEMLKQKLHSYDLIVKKYESVIDRITTAYENQTIDLRARLACVEVDFGIDQQDEDNWEEFSVSN
jgi:hypothetical protein